MKKEDGCIIHDWIPYCVYVYLLPLLRGVQQKIHIGFEFAARRTSILLLCMMFAIPIPQNKCLTYSQMNFRQYQNKRLVL